MDSIHLLAAFYPHHLDIKLPIPCQDTVGKGSISHFDPLSLSLSLSVFISFLDFFLAPTRILGSTPERKAWISQLVGVGGARRVAVHAYAEMVVTWRWRRGDGPPVGVGMTSDESSGRNGSQGLLGPGTCAFRPAWLGLGSWFQKNRGKKIVVAPRIMFQLAADARRRTWFEVHPGNGCGLQDWFMYHAT